MDGGKGLQLQTIRLTTDETGDTMEKLSSKDLSQDRGRNGRGRGRGKGNIKHNHCQKLQTTLDGLVTSTESSKKIKKTESEQQKLKVIKAAVKSKPKAQAKAKAKSASLLQAINMPWKHYKLPPTDIPAVESTSAATTAGSEAEAA